MEGVSNILSTVSMKTERYKLHKVRIYCRGVVLDCVGFSKVCVPNKLAPGCVVKISICIMVRSAFTVAGDAVSYG